MQNLIQNRDEKGSACISIKALNVLARLKWDRLKDHFCEQCARHFNVWCDSLRRWHHKPRSDSGRSTRSWTNGSAKWPTFRPSWNGHSVSRGATLLRSTSWGRSWKRATTQPNHFDEKIRTCLVSTSHEFIHLFTLEYHITTWHVGSLLFIASNRQHVCSGNRLVIRTVLCCIVYHSFHNIHKTRQLFKKKL